MGEHVAKSNFDILIKHLPPEINFYTAYPTDVYLILVDVAAERGMTFGRLLEEILTDYIRSITVTLLKPTQGIANRPARKIRDQSHHSRTPAAR